MIALPGLLAKAAEEVGMKVPADPDSEDYDTNKYPHFHVFLVTQLGKPMPTPTDHWDNAKLIAKIPNRKIKKVTLDDLRRRGVTV